MAVTPNKFVSTQKVKHGVQVFQNVDGTNPKTLFTAGANGSKVIAGMANNFDSAARGFRYAVVRSGGYYYLGQVDVPANASYQYGTPCVDLMAPSVIPGLPEDSDGQRYILLEPGDTLGGYILSAAGTIGIVVFFMGADF
jgi:hypothetical protein